MEFRQGRLTTSIGLLILRLGAGGLMATHGWGKLQMLLAGNFSKFSDPIGLGKGPSLVLATGAEFFCSLLVAAGLATRLAAAPVAFTMGVAAFVHHASDPLATKEPALVYLAVFVALMFTGPGALSLDAVLLPRLRSRKAPRPAKSPRAD